MMYRELDSASPVMALCRVPGWVQVSMGSRGTDTYESGWVEERHVRAGLSADAKDNIFWNLEGNSNLDANERDLLRAAARRVMKDDPDCRRIVDGSEFTQRPGRYFVVCEPDDPDFVYNVEFTATDVKRSAPLRRRR
jgi:hypothetical protein